MLHKETGSNIYIKEDKFIKRANKFMVECIILL